MKDFASAYLTISKARQKGKNILLFAATEICCLLPHINNLRSETQLINPYAA
jgi:hypothetical protein